MSEKYNNQLFATQQTILAALCLIVAFFGGCWFFSYHAYVTAPTTEAITVTLPPEMVASKAGLAEPVQTVEVVREKPERKYFSALLHPFGFMILLLVIVGTGGLLIFSVTWLGAHKRT